MKTSKSIQEKLKMFYVESIGITELQNFIKTGILDIY